MTNETAVSMGLVTKTFYISKTEDGKTTIVGEAGTPQQAEDAIFDDLLETMTVLQHRPNTSATIDVNKDRTAFELRTVTSNSPVHYDDKKILWSILEGYSYKDAFYEAREILKNYVENDFTFRTEAGIRERLKEAGITDKTEAAKYGLRRFFEEDGED